MKRKIHIYLFALSLSQLAFSGELIRNATITSINNISSNSDIFSIGLSGGTGICAATSSVIFNPSYFPTLKSYDRAFSLATVAFATGKKVMIYNYIDDTCDKASYILMSNSDI